MKAMLPVANDSTHPWYLNPDPDVEFQKVVTQNGYSGQHTYPELLAGLKTQPGSEASRSGKLQFQWQGGVYGLKCATWPYPVTLDAYGQHAGYSGKVVEKQSKMTRIALLRLLTVRALCCCVERCIKICSVASIIGEKSKCHCYSLFCDCLPLVFYFSSQDCGLLSSHLSPTNCGYLIDPSQEVIGDLTFYNVSMFIDNVFKEKKQFFNYTDVLKILYKVLEFIYPCSTFKIDISQTGNQEVYFALVKAKLIAHLEQSKERVAEELKEEKAIQMELNDRIRKLYYLGSYEKLQQQCVDNPLGNEWFW